MLPRTIDELKKDGYQGCDVSLEISLFEYGLVWKDEGEDYKFIFGVNLGPNEYGEMEYTEFDWGNVAKKADPLKEWDWIDDWDKVFLNTGLTKDDFLEIPLPHIVSDLISYYGSENILGSSYHTFTIQREENYEV